MQLEFLVLHNHQLVLQIGNQEIIMIIGQPKKKEKLENLSNKHKMKFNGLVVLTLLKEHHSHQLVLLNGNQEIIKQIGLLKKKEKLQKLPNKLNKN